nr:hypothetical protein [uncultured Deefgea sp.]
MQASRIYRQLLALYLPEATQPTPAALLKVERQGVVESGTLSDGRQNHNFRFHPDPALSQAMNRFCFRKSM